MGAGVTEYAAKGIIEEQKIALQIRFVKTVGDIFNEYAIALLLEFFLPAAI